MYFLWWNKSLDVRCHHYLLDKPKEPNDSKSEPNKPSEPDVPRAKPPLWVFIIFRLLVDSFYRWHKVYSGLQDVFTNVSRIISERRRQITTIWQSRPFLSKILILIRWTIMFPFILALIFSTLFTLVLVLLGLFLFTGWLSIFGTNIYRK